MRVLHVLHYCRGGIVTVVLNQILHSASPNIEYHLAVMEDCAELDREARARGIRLYVLGASWAALVWRYWRLVHHLRPDVIHTHSYVPRVLTALVTIFSGRRLRLVSTVHNDYPYLHASDPRSRFKRFTEGLFLRVRNRHTICCSEKIRRVVQEEYCVAPDRLRRIHNGIAISAARGAETRRVEAGADSSTTIAVTVGRLSEQKNYGQLLDCWRDVSKSHPRAELWIVGDGELRDSLEDKAKALGIGQTVRFWGWQPQSQVFDILRRADLFVLSSLHEGLPTAILEAYVMGLPVVSTRVSGVEEIIESGVTGYIVDKAAELTWALRTLIETPTVERVAMGQRGRQRVLTEFTAERYALDVEQTYVAG